MLNPAKGTATLAQVRRTELQKPPHAGRDWRGVQHGVLLDAVVKAAKDKGLTFKFRAAHVGRGGFDLAAGLVLEAGNLPALPKGWEYGLGLATSNANRYRLRFYVGAYRETADEGTYTALVAHAFRAEKRYTYQFELEVEAATAVERWTASAKKLGKKLDRLAAHRIDQDTAQRLLITAATDGLTPPSRAVRALKQVQATTKPSTLDLLAAFGDTAGLNPPDVQQDQLLGFFNRVRDLVAPAKT